MTQRNQGLQECPHIRRKPGGDETYEFCDLTEKMSGRIHPCLLVSGDTCEIWEEIKEEWAKESQPLDDKELRNEMAKLIWSLDGGSVGWETSWAFVHKAGVPYRLADQILALLPPKIEEAKNQIACDLFEELICPLCYRLNPQHADMDNGKGCHYCQEREHWGALKGGE